MDRFVAAVLAVSASSLFIASPLATKWDSTITTAEVYVYLAGGLLLLGQILRMFPQLENTGAFIGLPVIGFATLALGIVLEYDVDPLGRHIKGDMEDAPWALVVAGIATAAVCTSFFYHPPLKEAEEQGGALKGVSAFFAAAHFVLILVASVVIGEDNDDFDETVIGLSATSPVVSFAALAFLIWRIRAPAPSGGWSLSFYVLTEIVAVGVPGILAGYLFQTGNQLPESVGSLVVWLLTASAIVKICQWSFVHHAAFSNRSN